MKEWFVTKGSVWHGVTMFLHPKKILDVVGTRALTVGAGVLEPAGTNGTTFVSWPELEHCLKTVNSLPF